MDTNRKAVKSEDFVAKLAGVPKLSNEQKTAKLNQIWSADTDPAKRGAFKRIAQGMIGPIQIKLKYEGIGRTFWLRTFASRVPSALLGLDDLGQAYILNQTDAEVKTTPFEGKWAPPSFFRIASFPYIRKEEQYWLTANIVEHAQEMTREAILKQEDGRLLTLLASAVTDYATNPDHIITPDHIVEIGAGNPFEFADLLDAAGRVELHELKSTKVLLNPVDFRDILLWDVNLTGWNFKDDVRNNANITRFGEFEFQTSIMVPQGTLFLVPEANFLGVMPIMYSLDVEENNQIEQFRRGWVFDELIGMMVLNPRGLALVKKV